MVFFCLVEHFIFNDMALKFYHFSPGPHRRIHHFFGRRQAAIMIDAYLGNHKRRIGFTDKAAIDINKRLNHSCPIISFFLVLTALLIV